MAGSSLIAAVKGIESNADIAQIQKLPTTHSIARDNADEDDCKQKDYSHRN